MSFKMMDDRILLKTQKPKRKTDGGIYLPEQSYKKRHVGEVVAVGDKVFDVSVGDYVFLEKHSGTDTEIDGNDYVMIREHNVIFIAKDSEQMHKFSHIFGVEWTSTIEHGKFNVEDGGSSSFDEI